MVLSAKKIAILTLVLGFILSLLPSSSANALSAADWKPGRIIDDAIFFNKNSMTPAQIHAFLNAKRPTCWTNHPSYTSTFSGITTNPPFICLKDYYENPNTSYSVNYTYKNTSGQDVTVTKQYKPNNVYRITGFTVTYVNGSFAQGVQKVTPIYQNQNGVIPSGAKSAAQIIWDAAQTYSINPQVLIVMLQKEQSLITDDWPTIGQYNTAMGYACPDNGPNGSANCNTAYYGFYNQLDSAAWQLRRYVTYPDEYNFKAGVTRFIKWDVAASCGGKNVFIENAATAALYNYTPYQPNATALSNLTGGQDDGCSAYGNRNFWVFFNDWFGSSTSIQSAISINVVAQPPATVAKGQEITYSYTLTNNFAYTITLNSVGVAGRPYNTNSGINRDFGWQGTTTLAAGETRQFNFTSIPKDVGQLHIWPVIVFQNTYVHYHNSRFTLNVRSANLQVSSPLTISAQAPYYAGQAVTFSATIRNNDSVPIKIKSVGIPVRYYDKYSYDTAWTNSINTINPSQTIPLSGTITLNKPGPFKAWVSWDLYGEYSTISPIMQINVSSVQPAFILTYTETPNLSPALGEDVSVKFKLKNTLPVPITIDAVGIVSRLDSQAGQNRDFGWIGPEVFAPNQEKSYFTFKRNIRELNKHVTWVAINYKGSYIHYNTWGFTLTPRKPNISIATPLQITPNSLITKGQIINATVRIKNNEPKPIKFSAAGIPIKYFGVYNYDAGWVGQGTLSEAGQLGDSLQISGSVKLDKSGPYSYWTSLLFGSTYISIDSKKTLTVY